MLASEPTGPSSVSLAEVMDAVAPAELARAFAEAVVPTGPTRDHNGYVGGSDIAALVGASPYKSALDLWAEKTGRVPGFTGNEATEVGDHLERPVLVLYARRYGIRELTYPGTLTHPLYPHIAATPDAIAGDRSVQCKVVGVRQAHRWGDVHEGAEGLPPEVLCQVTYERAMVRRTLGIDGAGVDVVALIGTDLRVYRFDTDAAFGDDLITIADVFWQRNVLGGAMPEVIESGNMDVLRALFPRVRAGSAVQPVTTEVEELARAYDAARKRETEAADEKKAAGAKLVALVKDGAGFVSPERGIKVTWPEKAGSTSWKEVAARYRDAAVRMGAKGADLDAIEAACKGEPTRTIDVRVK
jgi:putative phage-type endonuclease